MTFEMLVKSKRKPSFHGHKYSLRIAIEAVKTISPSS